MKIGSFITALMCCFIMQAYAQSITDYLKSNCVDITSKINESSLLDADFFDHRIFLLGESHGIQQPQQIDFNFLKLLNEKARVRTYLAEIDFAKAWYLNRYLDHGDERLLDTVFADWVKQDAQWANKDF